MFPEVDVVSGGWYIIDKKGSRGRKLWSYPMTRLGLAHGGSTLIQPSTFFKRKAFEQAGGFNTENRSCWDAELVRDMLKNGLTFKQVNDFWPEYRLYDKGITGSGQFHVAPREYRTKTHERLFGRKPSRSVSNVNYAIFPSKAYCSLSSEICTEFQI